VGAIPAHAFEESSGNVDNVVDVVNRNNGSLATKARTALAHNGGPSVTNGNGALARASCTDCRTVAVAVQVVLTEGPVNDFRPQNAAVALNENCIRCQTFAYARQEVLNPGRPVRIGDSAQAKIDGIDRRMSQLAASTEPFDRLAADLDSLTVEMVGVVQGEVQRAGTTAVDQKHREVRVDER
jgi:putative peptide zinc metalloprotease protein